MSRKVLLAAGAMIAVLVIALAVVLPRRLREEPPPPTEQAAFRLTEVKAFDSARPERVDAASQRGSQVGAAVVRMLNNYYEVAFAAPADEPEGVAPGPASEAELRRFFTKEAATRIGRDLEALALGPLAREIQGLSPTRQEALVTLHLEPDLSAPLVIVVASFDAEAEEVPPERGVLSRLLEGPPVRGAVKLEHRAFLWLIREGDSYRIMAYRFHLESRGVERSAAFGVGEEMQ